MPPPDPLVARLRAAGCVFAEDEAALLRSAASGEALEALVVRRVAGEPLEVLLGALVGAVVGLKVVS
jgi:release factor glutamine methyltransferase